MNQDRFYDLVSLRLSGEAGSEELHELESYLKANPGERNKVETLVAIWEARRVSTLSKKESFNRHMQRLSNHFSEPVLQYENVEIAEQAPTEERTSRTRLYRKLQWALAIAAAVIIGFLVIPNFKTGADSANANARNTVSTKRGSKSKVVLPDGTQVWLNSDSRITYNEKFHDQVREVELTGEAYFDVVRDENRPFIIHTNTIDVKVLGTAFNVRSYAEEKNTETSLIRGSVEITLVKSPDKKKIILKPNDKLIVTNDGQEVVEETSSSTPHKPVLTLAKINCRKMDSMAVETLWITNKLAFDSETLEEIAMKIERWYDVKLIFADEKLKKETYTATFEDKTLSEVMEALRATGGFRYSINKKDVTISVK